MKKTILMLALLILSIMPFVFAQTGGSPSAPLTTTLSAQDITTFDQILEPVMRIYGFFKYIASVIGVIILVFAGIMYMTSGATPSKREQAKNMVAYTIIGLIIIWSAPLIVGLFV